MNLPNLLSLLRIFLVPVFAAVFFSGSESAHQYAALIYLAASLTDILDGFIARKFGLITKIGRILDPLADKLMTATVLICVAVDGIIPVLVVILFVLKECMMGIGALVMLKRVKDVMPSNFLGKLTTIVFFLVLASLLLFKIPTSYSAAMVSAALALMLISLVLYTWRFYNIVKNPSSRGKSDCS